jgi:hypothetical protein
MKRERLSLWKEMAIKMKLKQSRVQRTKIAVIASLLELKYNAMNFGHNETYLIELSSVSELKQFRSSKLKLHQWNSFQLDFKSLQCITIIKLNQNAILIVEFKITVFVESVVSAPARKNNLYATLVTNDMEIKQICVIMNMHVNLFESLRTLGPSSIGIQNWSCQELLGSKKMRFCRMT